MRRCWQIFCLALVALAATAQAQVADDFLEQKLARLEWEQLNLRVEMVLLSECPEHGGICNSNDCLADARAFNAGTDPLVEKLSLDELAGVLELRSLPKVDGWGREYEVWSFRWPKVTEVFYFRSAGPDGRFASPGPASETSNGGDDLSFSVGCSYVGTKQPEPP